MRLNQLKDNPGAHQGRKLLGRGIGSGLGKTCGRGQKGQKARSGVAIKGFEGGQMPLQMRLPKRGFKRGFVRGEGEAVVNLGRLQKAIDTKKINIEEIITPDILVNAGLLRNSRPSVRLLAKGDFTSKIKIQVSYVSAGALEIIQKAGGEVILPPQKEKKTKKEKIN